MTLSRLHPFRLAVLASAALLAACAPQSEALVRPTAPAQFAGPARLNQPAADAPAPRLGDWWLGFDDPVLTALEQRALAQNLDLAAALARVDQARAAAQDAGAARLPQLGLDGDVAHERQSLLSPDGELARAHPGYTRGQTLQRLGVGASWEADLAGGLRAGEAAAVAEWQAAAAAQMGTRVSVAAEVADAYFRVRGAQARLAVTEQQVRTEDQLLGLVLDRLAHGLGTEREAAEARAELQRARGALPPLRVELAEQLHRLDTLLGAPAGSEAAARVAGAAAYAVPALPAELTPAELMRRRPDVIAAERELDARHARIGVAAAEYYPRLSLGGLVGGESLHGALFSAAAFQPEALLGLHWRLFDFGRVDAEVAQAHGAEAEALARLRATMLRATEDVEDALVAQAGLEAQREALAAEVDARLSARATAADAYRGGAVSLVEVLAQDRALLGARERLAALQAARARAAVAAFRAFGGGWEPAPAAETRS
ncbi:MAG: TolC family protein [Pelomonas sp.]|nr:TolC family protein [Roseateles sp.]